MGKKWSKIKESDVRKIIVAILLLSLVVFPLFGKDDAEEYKKYLTKVKNVDDKDSKKKVGKGSELATSTTVINIKDTSRIDLQRK